MRVASTSLWYLQVNSLWWLRIIDQPVRPSVSGLSDGLRDWIGSDGSIDNFLRAMSKDDTASRTSDIAQRLKVSSGYLSTYRVRLIDADVVFAPRRGYLDYSIPFLREYLRATVT